MYLHAGGALGGRGPHRGAARPGGLPQLQEEHAVAARRGWVPRKRCLHGRFRCDERGCCCRQEQATHACVFMACLAARAAPRLDPGSFSIAPATFAALAPQSRMRLQQPPAQPPSGTCPPTHPPSAPPLQPMQPTPGRSAGCWRCTATWCCPSPTRGCKQASRLRATPCQQYNLCVCVYGGARLSDLPSSPAYPPHSP